MSWERSFPVAVRSRTGFFLLVFHQGLACRCREIGQDPLDMELEISLVLVQCVPPLSWEFSIVAIARAECLRQKVVFIPEGPYVHLQAPLMQLSNECGRHVLDLGVICLVEPFFGYVDHGSVLRDLRQSGG